MVMLRNDVKAGVFLEGLRDVDALRCLMVFEQCGHDARQGEGAAVEGVHELDVAVFVLEAKFQSVGLEGLEVGDRADFEPELLGCRPHFDSPFAA